jgi:hypothetical protein
MAGRPMLRTSRTHKAAAATFEAVESAAEAIYDDGYGEGWTYDAMQRKIDGDIYIVS